VTLRTGDLVDAALASMAVPGLYPSQRIDGRILIDGGMSKQVPIDIAREMGADIVIVVDLTLPPPRYDERSPSMIETVMQMVNLQVWQNRQAQIQLLAPRDVHIAPDTTGYSTSGFDRVDEGFDIGYKATIAHAERLKAIALEAAPSRVRPAPPPEKFTVSSVKVATASGISEDLILERFGVEPGDNIVRGDVYKGLSDVAALGAFDVVDYRITPGATGSDLKIVTVPGGIGNQYLQVGLKLSTTPDGDAYYGLLGRWSYKPLNRYAGELNLTAEIGTNIDLDAEWVQPVGRAGRYFVESGVNYVQRTVPVNLDEVRLAERRDQATSLRVNFGSELGQWGLVSAGAFALALDSDVRVGDTLGLGAQSGKYIGVTGRFAADTMNASSFPISGQLADLVVSGFAATDDGDNAATGRLVLGSAQVLGGFGTFVRYEGGLIDQHTDGLPTFALGGFKRLSGFEDNSVPATSYNLLRLEGFTRLGASVEQTFGVPVYLGATLEGASVEFDALGVSFADEFVAGSIYGAVTTPLGPAYLAVGLGESGRQSFYLYFGRGF
jgi:NTE family protein